PHRFPAGYFSAFAAACKRAWSMRSSYTTASQLPSSRRPRRVIKSPLPQPAPTRYTLPILFSLMAFFLPVATPPTHPGSAVDFSPYTNQTAAKTKLSGGALPPPALQPAAFGPNSPEFPGNAYLPPEARMRFFPLHI